MPTLTINTKGVMQLHVALRQRLSLRHGQPIDLVAPYGNTPYWYLDLRETAARRVLWHEKSRMRAVGIELPPGLVEHALTLELLPGEPAYPNYYPLQLVHAQPARP